MRIKAFSALRPPTDLARDVASPPYDVVDTGQARQLAGGNPKSFLHVVRPEIDLPEGLDVYDDSVYQQGAAALQAFQERGYLVRDIEPALYVYRLTSGNHAQTGVVCCCHVEDYEQDLIKKHEKTRRVKEDDRTRHVLTMGAHAGPVFLTYRDDAGIDALIDDAMKQPPLYDFVAVDGVAHTLWKLAAPSTLVSAFGNVPCTYVADGHHRAASAARAAAVRREASKGSTGDEEYNWFLTVLFPASQLQILPYNRVVADLNGMTAERFLDAVRSVFDVEDNADPQPDRVGQVRMYVASTWYGLSWKTDNHCSPVDALDVSVLQDRVLAPVLGIDDPRENPRIDFVGGIHGTEELAKRVDAGDAQVAFSMYPTTVEQLMAIADAGQIMPPKSTWFEPKLRSGLLVHTLD